MTLLKKYEVIKKAEGEMLQFYALLLKQNIDNESLNKINRLLSAARSALFATKSLKDIIQNVKEYSNSSTDIKYNRFKEFQQSIDTFNTNYRAIFLATNTENAAEQLQNLQTMVEDNYQQDVLKTYQQVSKGTLKETNISTAFNFNREIHDSCKSLIMAAKDFLLDESKEVNFNNGEKNNLQSS